MLNRNIARLCGSRANDESGNSIPGRKAGILHYGQLLEVIFIQDPTATATLYLPVALPLAGAMYR